MIKTWSKFVQGVYGCCMQLAAGKYALPSLLVVSFVESSFFPIPPDILLIPLVLSRRRNAFKIAFWTTVSSVIGGMFGYYIGYFLYDTIGISILNFFHYAEKFKEFQSLYNKWGAWIVFGAGITPFPYKIITIASGVTHLNLMIFIIASVIARGLRFYLISGLLWKFGEPVKNYIEKNLGWLSVLFFLLLAGGFALIKWL